MLDDGERVFYEKNQLKQFFRFILQHKIIYVKISSLTGAVIRREIKSNQLVESHISVSQIVDQSNFTSRQIKNEIDKVQNLFLAISGRMQDFPVSNFRQNQMICKEGLYFDRSRKFKSINYEKNRRK